jgi:hypothetical protein
MDSQNPELLAAVLPAFVTGSAMTASDVRFDRAFVPNLDPNFVGVHPHHCAREFVPDYPGICVDRMPSRKSMEVAPTHAHLLHSEQSFAGRWFWYGNVALQEYARRFEHELLHLVLDLKIMVQPLLQASL